MRCRALVDLAADLGAAGEHHAVQALRDQLLAHHAVALDHRDRVVVEVARHQLGHQPRRRRGDFRGLEDHGVSGGDRPDRRTQRQVERVIPGADDQHGAVGLVLHPAATGQLRQLQQQVLAARPLAHLLGRVLRFADGRRDVGDERLDRVAVQILGERLGDRVLVLLHQLLPAAATAACATRCRGCGRWRRSCAAGPPSRRLQLGEPVARLVLVVSEVFGATDSVVIIVFPSRCPESARCTCAAAHR